jgi:hypothetical protein
VVGNVNEAPSIETQHLNISDVANTPQGVPLAASDPDAGDQLTFTMLGGDPAFVVDSTTGALSLSQDTGLQFEPGKTYLLTVEVRDAQGLTDNATISIHIDSTTEDLGLDEGSNGSSASATTESQSSSDSDSQSSNSSGGQASDSSQSSPEEDQIFVIGGEATPELLPELGAKTTADLPLAPSPLSSVSPMEAKRILFELAFNRDADTSNQTVVNNAFNRLSLALNLGSQATEVLEDFSRRIANASLDHTSAQVAMTKTATAATITLSAGFAAWTLRSGALLASLFASTPLWRQFDPLPVLGNDDDEDDWLTDASDLQDIFDDDMPAGSRS